MTEKMDFYGIRDIMNETLNEKKAFVPRHGDKESLDNITAQLNEAKMHPCVFLNNHAIGIEAAGDFMKLLNSGEEQYADNDMVDKDLLKNVYNTLKKIYKDEGKKLKESTMFDSVLKESGIEVYPEDGKLKARNIGQQVVSSRTQNKLNPLGTKDVAKPLTPTQKAATSAVLNILNDKGKAGDINSEFDTNPRPDITLMANGDAVITPDGQKSRSYKIPASEIDAHMKESIDPTGAAFNLTKLKGYLKFETRWEYDEDDIEDAMLVDKVHEPPRFTVNWIGPKGKKHPNTYCVNIRKDRGESWTWITHFCLKASDAAEMINLEVGTWEHNNEPWKFCESKERLPEGRVFSHSSGFGLSGHYGYEEPKKEPLYIATETNEDDGELYFDEEGNTTEFKTDAKKFTSKEDALEFAKSNVIFGEPGTKLLENCKLNEDGLFKPFAGITLTMAALTAFGVHTKNFDEKCKAIADELGVKLDKNAFDQHGAGYYMPYLQSFKYDGGSKNYGMTPEGLCEYIKKTADVTRVNYEKVEGGVKISFLDKYLVNVGKVISRREAVGSFFVPDSYFDVSFIFNESYNKKSSLKEYFFYAPPHSEEDEEDSIIGYVAAVRDYRTQKTKYVDDDGNVCNSKSQAIVFNTKGKADNYSYDHCPEGWTHFVVALKKSDILNESNVVIASWRRETAERLIKEANKIDPSYSFVEYDIGPKKEIKHKIYKNDDEYVGTFDVFTDEPYNSPYRFFFHHVNIPNVEFQGMDIDEFDKMFKDFIITDKRLGHKH